jgi:hypothetical protein
LGVDAIDPARKLGRLTGSPQGCGPLARGWLVRLGVERPDSRLSDLQLALDAIV